MAPTTKPTLTVSTATHLPGDSMPLLPGLGEPYVSRAVHEYQRAHPAVKPTTIVPFTASIPPTWEAGKRFWTVLGKTNVQTAEKQKKAHCQRGTRCFRAMMAEWAEEKENREESASEECMETEKERIEGFAEWVLREEESEEGKSAETEMVDSVVEVAPEASWWETMSAAQVGGEFEEVEMVAGNVTV